ncbi:MAG: peptidylprolyl isomerase [Tannerella sp.]|jgi:peptidyl-prolyl cis-trans isomerase SurA|nr:peptidylprolyl isomerase [Tannerella sp.]
MRKIVLLLVSVVLMTAVEAKVKKDPIIMTVAGKDIPLSEFLYIAKKDNSVDLKDAKSVEKYVELFKNYKLKVADAEALTMNQTEKFEKELEQYKQQLQASYLQDTLAENSALRRVYERIKVIPRFKHLMFFLPDEKIVSKDTVDVYNKAIAAYNRIINGENIDSVGFDVSGHEKSNEALYETVDCIYPLQMLKTLDEKLYSMNPGEVSTPVRSMLGFHIFKLEELRPNPGKVLVAPILTAFPNNTPTEKEKEETLKKSEEIYNKAISGEDFKELAKQFSSDTVSGKNGGLLPLFGLCEMLKPFEDIAFAFKNIGDISKPVETQYGYHILKLLEKQPVTPFEEMESQLYSRMENSEYNFDLYKGFDEKVKKKHNYVYYPEAYEELSALADNYFPTDSSFYNKGRLMEKIIMRLDSVEFPQYEFVEYMVRKPYSAKRYSIDFMNELFAMFGRDVATELERRSLEKSNPEYNLLINEYYDGILLFEVSNKRVWSRPVEEQANLETEWLKELDKKYPVKINGKILKKIKKYL